MSKQQIISETSPHSDAGDGFQWSIDDLLAQLALDNYSLVPCQD
jgi:hypothetical protein